MNLTNRFLLVILIGIYACATGCGSESGPQSTNVPQSFDQEAAAPHVPEAPELPLFQGVSPGEYETVRTMYYNAILGPDDDLRAYLLSIEDAEIEIALTEYEQAHDNDWAASLVEEGAGSFVAYASMFSDFNLLKAAVENLHLYPEIKEMLEDELYTQDDILIIALGDRKADTKIGIAKCINGYPAILFGRPRTVNQKITAHAWVFFKYHEYAHHLLDHISCRARGGLSKEEEHRREFAADCLAGKILRHRFPIKWHSIVTAMHGKLSYRLRRGEGRETDTHPSLEVRKDSLNKYANAGFASCETDFDVNIESLQRMQSNLFEVDA